MLITPQYLLEKKKVDKVDLKLVKHTPTITKPRHAFEQKIAS